MAGATTEPVANVAAQPYDELSSEEKAWQAYAEACWNPVATVEHRREPFDRALALLEAP